MDQIRDPDAPVREVERRLKEDRPVEVENRLLLPAGTAAGRPGGTNLMKSDEVT
jgi:hypothetical protein